MRNTNPLRQARLVTGAAVLALTVGSGGDASAQSASPAVPVTISRASLGSVESSVTATGTVVSRNDARLAAEVPGRLTWVVEPGAQVEKGAVLARVDTSMLELQLRENEAQVLRLEANAGLLATQLGRLESLGAGIASRSQIDEAAARLAMARQECEQARVARDRTRQQIARAAVRAPFPGHVVERIRQLGEFVGPGTELLRLTDTRDVEVIARAPVAEAMHLGVGQEVRVSVGDTVAASRIRALVPVGDDRSRMLELRISTNGTVWPIGSAVRVELPADAAGTQVVIPRDAVIVRAGSAHVFRVGADDVAEQVPVRLGRGDGVRVEVVEGLASGDRVVVRGGERLSPGQLVRVAAAVAPGRVS